MISIIFFTLVGLIAIEGGRTQVGPYSVDNPRPRFFLGLLTFVGWRMLRNRNMGRQVSMKGMLGRVMLLSISLGLTVLVAEKLFRWKLDSSQGFGTLEMFREYEEGRAIPPQSRHPVSEVITLSNNKRLIYESRANMDRIYGPERVITNADGIRAEHDYEVAKADGQIRIVGIGDSGMWGWNTPQDGNYLAVLENSLKKDGASVEILNGGVPGYNTQQQVEWLDYRGLKYSPDIVIVGWCNNDYDAPFFLYRPVDFTKLEGSLVYQYLFARRDFYEAAKPKVLIYTNFKNSGIPAEVFEGMGPEGVEKSLTRLLQMSQQHNFKVLVFGPMDETVVGICEKLELPVFNTLTEIPDDRYPKDYLVHHMHPSPEGHRALGGYLLKELRRLEWVP